MTGRAPGADISTVLRGTADALGQLLASHLKLARLELIDNAGAVGRRVAVAASFAVLGAVGYVLVALGVAALLQPAMGWARALLLVGALHLLVGALGALIAVRRLQAIEVLDSTAQAVSASVATLRPSEPETGPIALEAPRAL